MVRLEILGIAVLTAPFLVFTFQYGQIRNDFKRQAYAYIYDIYIPVWLDQKYVEANEDEDPFSNLHSSMVRLEMVQVYIML